MNKLVSIEWSVCLGYHVVKKILPFGFQFRVEKWRSYGSLDLDPGEMISYWHPIMWKPAS